MTTFTRTIALLAALAVAGCAAPRTTPEASRLNGTDWVLIGFQPSLGAELQEVRLYDYTAHFDPTGDARFKFDCNRGSATWRADPAGGGRGSLSFGPVAATTALCPSGSIGEALSADLARIKGYSIDDGKLTMTPDGEGRIYVWDRID